MPWNGSDRCVIHYARSNRLPHPRWRDREGTVVCVGHRPGPRNVLVRTEVGAVVVPWRNVRPAQGLPRETDEKKQRGGETDV